MLGRLFLVVSVTLVLWVLQLQCARAVDLNETLNTSINETNTTVNETVVYKGLKIEVYADDVLYRGIEEKNLFKIKNMDHVSGIKDCVNVTIQYSIHLGDEAVKVDFAEIICMNSFKTSGTGYFTPNKTGTYALCGNITRTTAPNSTGRSACKNITVKDPELLPCNVSLTEITQDGFLYREGDKVSYKIDIDDKTYPFLIEYSITDLFGNYIRNPRNTSNTNKRSFTPNNLEEKDAVFMINAEVFPFCNDINESDNKMSEFLIVTSNKEKDPISVLSVKEIMTKEPRFGSAVLVNLIAYKGDTNKRVINVYATTKTGTKISEITKLYLKEKFTSYDFKVPVQLRPNCQGKREDGIYYIVAEGLDSKERQRFRITNNTESSCQEVIKEVEKNNTIEFCNETEKTIEETKTRLLTKSQDKIVESDDSEYVSSILKNKVDNRSHSLTGMTVYQSASVRSVKLIPLIFIMACAIISSLIILKKL